MERSLSTKALPIINRSTTLYNIRIIAISGIIVDHYLQCTGNTILVTTGLWMGGVFLMVFFALSAYLFGMKWTKGNYEVFKAISFMKKRSLRIYIPLWLTLPVLIVVEYLISHSLDVKTVVFNILGLGWAKPFGTGGHLWYITLMMFLYFVFATFSRIRLDKLCLIYWLFGYVALFAIYVLGESHFATFSSVAPVITVFLASLLFFKSDEVMKLCQLWTKSLLFVTVTVLVLSWWMYAQGWHDTHKAIATFSSFSAGFCLFYCLMTFMKSSQSNRFVSHLADISYEVYLVHLPLLHLISYLLKIAGFDGSWCVAILIWLALTCALAVCVHRATQRINLVLIKSNKYE